MSDIAIKVDHLGKRYKIGGGQAHYKTLRESLMAAAGAPLRWLQGERREDKTFWALDDVSFEVKHGEAVGIIGRNGAGKSTLLKILSRITKPTRGRVELFGRVGSLLEVGTGFHPELSGRENIYLNAAILGMSRKEIERKFDEIVDFAEVEKFLDTPVKFYSSGMYVRLAFAVAAHLEPEILVVDEVLAVGDINFRRKSLGKMHDVARQGRTVIFVSHDMSSIRQLCQRVLWLGAGNIREQGTADELTVRYETMSYEQSPTNNGRFERIPAPAKNFYFDWIELHDAEGNLQTQYRYGETIDIIMSLHGEAPQDGFTIEWILFNESGNRISAGAANPLCDVYFNRGDQLISCRIGPLPLTSGKYRFYFSVRVWGLERWDEWDSGVSFRVVLCDPYTTGFDSPNPVNGDFVIDQRWKSIN